MDLNNLSYSSLASCDFSNVSLSDIGAIKALIKYRCYFDKYYKTTSSKNPEDASIVQSWNEDVICLYVDLDNLIKRIKFSQKQFDILLKFMDGWPSEEIAELYKDDLNNIDQILLTICSKIKKQNDDDWLEVTTLNYVKTIYDYKQCNRCEKWKPAIEAFFGKDERLKDGFKSYCKKCD